MPWFSSLIPSRPSRARTAHDCLRPLRLLARFWPEEYVMFEAMVIPRGEDLVVLDAVILGPRGLLVVCLETEEDLLKGEVAAGHSAVHQRAGAQVKALCRLLDLPTGSVSVVMSGTGPLTPAEGKRPKGVVLEGLRKLIESPTSSASGWDKERFARARAALEPFSRAHQRRLARRLLPVPPSRSCRSDGESEWG